MSDDLTLKDYKKAKCPHCNAILRVNDPRLLQTPHTMVECPKCKQPFELAVHCFNPIPTKPEISQVPPQLPPQVQATESPIQNASEENHTEPPTQNAVDTTRRLAIFIFLATLLGSLLGVAADLEGATGLLVRVVEWFDPSPHISIAGSNTILGEDLGVATAWKQDFISQNLYYQEFSLLGSLKRSIEITIDAVGSHKGYQQVLEGKVHILVASEPLTAKELEELTQKNIQIQCAVEIGYDVIVFVTDMTNSVPVFEEYGITNFLAGKITKWSDVTDAISDNSLPIHILARRGSGTTDLVLQAFTDTTIFQKHFLECSSNTDCLDKTLSIPGSIYWVSSAWLHTQPPRYLHPILIRYQKSVQNPMDEGFDPRYYPHKLIRALYAYVLKSPEMQPEIVARAIKFLKYIRGVQGQLILEKHHFYTYFNPPYGVNIDLPSDFARQPGSVPRVCLTE